MSDIKMRGPEDCAQTLSFGGETYSVDKKGVFTVPVEAYGQLIGQGFTATGDIPDTGAQP